MTRRVLIRATGAARPGQLAGLGQAMAILSLGSVVVVVLLLTLFPETAHHSLEDLNPEDDPVPPIPPTAGAGGFL